MTNATQADQFSDTLDEDDDDFDHGQMTEQEMGDLLANLLQGDQLEDVCDEDVTVRSFDECGVLTRNESLVVRVGGVEFQVTIVRSR